MKIRVIALASILVAVGCGDGPTRPPDTESAPPRPTPTPLPSPNIAGSWSGTFSALFCYPQSPAPAKAELMQEGARVHGKLSASLCIFGGTLEGTLKESSFSGTLSKGTAQYVLK